MHLAQVAIARGPRTVLSYEIPTELLERVRVGCRVLVPLGRSNRRMTAYVVECALDADPPAHAVKRISDVLDDKPLFDEAMLQLFKFISGYYYSPLGDVIRAGLPGGLNVKDARVATLTELGAARSELDPALSRLAQGPRPTAKLGASMSRLLRLCDEGLLTLTYQLTAPRARSRMVNVVSLTGQEPTTALRSGGGPARLLELLRDEGPHDVPKLRGRVPNHNAAVRRLVSLGAARIEQIQSIRDPWRGEGPEEDTRPELTADQRAAVEAITAVSDAGKYQGFLLYGVTGSGKTEVYLHALEHVLTSGGGGIVLVPEIALTPQLAGRFRARFGDRVAVLHSGLSDGERLDQWQLIRRGERSCVVGARSALFAPVPNLGMIVVDEEHEGSFKQDESPRYHARDMALKHGHTLGIPVVLGSATPSLETMFNAEAGRLARLDLPVRIGKRPLPTVELVDLRETPPVRPNSLLSPVLIDAIRETTGRGEQSIVFLNRRGFSSCMVCQRCGHVPECVDCSVSLTYHRIRRRLSCHYCGHKEHVPVRCSECREGELRLASAGTEQIEAVLAELVPEARVARMDRDTTRGRALRELLGRFRRREIDVLVGTQMVAKGHDFPQVTLVGVLLAEQLLKLQDFRAAERTFQLLTQVAGRAGRHNLAGRVLIQTFDPRHFSLQRAVTHDTDGFVSQELRLREFRGYPPYSHVVLVRIDGPDAGQVKDTAFHVADLLLALIRRDGLGVDLLGPNPALMERLKGRTRFQILMKAPARAHLHQALVAIQGDTVRFTKGVRLAIDVDPVALL